MTAGPYLDRIRASRLMAEAGIDALALTQPENIPYATGINPGVATLFRRAGAAIALVPSDGAVPAGAVLPDLAAGAAARSGTLADIRFLPIWVGVTELLRSGEDPVAGRLAAGHAPALERPSTFDARAGFGLLRDMLAERGLTAGVLGVEMDFLPANDLALMRSVLPEARIVDASDTVRRLRMVKSQREIALLRAGLEISEAALAAILPLVRPGAARDMLGAAFIDAAKAAAQRRGAAQFGSAWEYISIGRSPWGAPATARPGDVVKVDIGAVLAGYSSDSARTFTLGPASADQKAVYGALRSGFEEGLPMLRPGARLSDVHAAMIGTIRRSGLPGYARGHFGHGLGQSVFSEEWPFIAADSDVTIEADMVLALEAPYYVDGLGGFIVEDQVLVTAEGPESMNTASRDLIAL
jgi:Xaa-Pro dipeptidase